MLTSLLRNWCDLNPGFRDSLRLMIEEVSLRKRRAMSRRQFMRGFNYGQSLSINNQFGIGGLSFSATTNVSGDITVNAGPVSVPAAQSGSVTTHTSNSDVVLTMSSSSHGITNTARCDLYWSGGYRRGMVASNVSGTSVELTGGTGTNAPAVSTAVNVGLCVEREFSFTNANIALIACQCNYECVFDFLESDGTTEDWYQHLTGTNGSNMLGWWYSAFGASPITGTAIAKVWMSHADPVAAHDMQASCLLTT